MTRAFWSTTCDEPDPDTHIVRLCRNAPGHDGRHRWLVEIDMEGWLPNCGTCGEKASRCPCPVVLADGRPNRLPVPDPPPPDPRSLALIARVEHRAAVAAAEHYAPPDPTAKPPKRFVPAPPPPPRAPEAPFAGRWCPAHARDVRSGCQGCGTAREITDVPLLGEHELPPLEGVLGAARRRAAEAARAAKLAAAKAARGR